MKIKRLLLILVALNAGTAFGEIERLKKVPPAWKVPSKKSEEHAKVTETSASEWFIPRFGLGMGLNFPDIVPFDGMLFFGKYVALRFFWAPPVPVNVLVEMPTDKLTSFNKNVGFAYPATDIKFKASYGPQYGIETFVFPSGGAFFVAGGASIRRFSIKGHAQSPIYICSMSEYEKDPPCGDEKLRIQTRTELSIQAQTDSFATFLRGSIGGLWNIGSHFYLIASLGVAKPLTTKRNMNVHAGLVLPGSDLGDEINQGLADMRAQQEAAMEKKALEVIKPYDAQTLPAIGVTGGYLF